MPLAPALLLLAASVAPGPLAELDARLAALAAREPVRATFKVSHEAVNGEGKDAVRTTGEAAGTVAEGPGGLEVSWPRALVTQAREEDRRRATDPAAPGPASDGLAAVSTLQLSGYLDAVGELRQALAGASLVEERQDAVDGTPARLLVLKLDPVLSPRDRRYVREVESRGLVWLGADGLPIAAEVSAKISGRAFLVVTFKAEQRDTYRFERAGDRLVVVRHEATRRSEGAGDRGERRTVAVLSLRPAPAP